MACAAPLRHRLAVPEPKTYLLRWPQSCRLPGNGKRHDSPGGDRAVHEGRIRLVPRSRPHARSPLEVLGSVKRDLISVKRDLISAPIRSLEVLGIYTRIYIYACIRVYTYRRIYIYACIRVYTYSAIRSLEVLGMPYSLKRERESMYTRIHAYIS